jgi:hypothetical protein
MMAAAEQHYCASAMTAVTALLHLQCTQSLHPAGLANRPHLPAALTPSMHHPLHHAAPLTDERRERNTVSGNLNRIQSHLLEVLRRPSLGGTCRCCHCTCQCPVLNPRLHIGGWDSAQLLWLPEPHFMMLLDVMTAPQHTKLTKLTHQQQADQSSTAMTIAGRGLPAMCLAGPSQHGMPTHPPPLSSLASPASTATFWTARPHHDITAASGNTQPHIMTSQQPLATHRQQQHVHGGHTRLHDVPQ